MATVEKSTPSLTDEQVNRCAERAASRCGARYTGILVDKGDWMDDRIAVFATSRHELGFSSKNYFAFNCFEHGWKHTEQSLEDYLRDSLHDAMHGGAS